MLAKPAAVPHQAFGQQSQSFEVGGQEGFNLLSCQTLKVETQNDFLSGNVLSCAGTVGSGQEVKMLINSAEGFVLEHPVVVSAAVEQQDCYYPISRTGQQIYSVGNQRSACSGYTISTSNTQADPVFEVGQIPAVPTQVKFKIRVKIDYDNGLPVGEGVLNNDNTATYIYDQSGSKIAYVKWIGNLQSLSYCSTVQQYFVRSTSGSNLNWRAISTADYQSYLSSFNLALGGACTETYISQGCTGGLRSNNCDGSKAYYAGITSDLITRWNALQSLPADNFVTTPSAPIVAPLIQTYVKGDLLGLRIPVGMPHFTLVSTDRIVATVPTKTFVTLQNVGSDKDCFDFSLNCPLRPQISLFANRMCLDAGASSSSELTVNGLDGTVDCVLKAQSIGKPENLDTASVRYTIFKPACPSQAQCCSEDTVYEPRACAPQATGKTLGLTSSGVQKTASVTYQLSTCQQFSCVPSGYCTALDLTQQFTGCTDYSSSSQVSCPSANSRSFVCTGDVSNLKAFETPVWLTSADANGALTSSQGVFINPQGQNQSVFPSPSPTSIIEVGYNPIPPQKPQDNTLYYVVGALIVIGGAAFVFMRR